MLALAAERAGEGMRRKWTRPRGAEVLVLTVHLGSEVLTVRPGERCEELE
jgi:hypothetical protein